MKRNKAAGEDGIKIEFIQRLPKEIARMFHEKIQDIWSESKIHENWTLARIIPIHKVGDNNNVRNYRGVALLDVGYKILTSMVAK